MMGDSLKKSILLSAFKGNLTSREKSDTDINEYLELIKRFDKIKRKDLEDKFESLYEIPDNWKWVQLGDITGIYGGKRIPAGRKLSEIDTGYKYIRVADMNDNTVELNNIKFVPEDIYCQIKNYTINKDDLYITVAGTIGKIGYIPAELDGANLTENANKIVFSNINKKWLFYVLKSPVVQQQIENMITKVGQPKLAIKRIVNILIPLPPIEEQQRIVEKIEEIFDEIDDIYSIEEELNVLKGNFPSDIKKSIIKSAVSGRLTKQNKNESVNLIIENIENKINKKIISVSNYPFEIPSNWFWIKFGDLVNFEIGKTPPRADLSYWSNNEFHWISISDMIDNGFITDTKEYVSNKAYKEIYKEKISKKGTLIMSFKLTVGRCSILNIDSFHNEGIISIYPNYDSEILKNYLFKILPFITKYGNTKNAIKGNTLNSKSLNDLLIPLPPIEEQQRIVDKLEQLLPICDDIYKIVSK